jgi:predicted ATP-dependent Lon-type protease
MRDRQTGHLGLYRLETQVTSGNGSLKTSGLSSNSAAREAIKVGWTKQTPTSKTAVFKIEGDRKSGFVYSAKIEGQDSMEITGFLEELTREQVEVMFANYVA